MLKPKNANILLFSHSVVIAALLLNSCVVSPYSSDDILRGWKKEINVARSLQSSGDMQAAQKVYEKALGSLNESEDMAIFRALTLSELGLLRLKSGLREQATADLNRAVDIFKASKKRDPDTFNLYTRQNFDALFNLGFLAKQSGDNEKALLYFREALNSGGSEQDRDTCRVQILSLEHGSVAASAYSNKILAEVIRLSSANKGGSIIERADSLVLSKEPQLALENLFAYLDVCKRSVRRAEEAICLIHIIEACYSAGDLRRCEEYCHEALQSAERDIDYSRLRSIFLALDSIVKSRRSGEDPSRPLLEKAIYSETKQVKRESLASTLDFLSQIDMTAGRLHSAEILCEMAIESIKEFPESSQYNCPFELHHAQILFKFGDLQRSERICLDALKKTPESSYLPYLKELLAEICLKTGRLTEAADYGKQAKIIMHDQAARLRLKLLLARICIARKDFAGARRELAEMQRGMPASDKNLSADFEAQKRKIEASLAKDSGRE